MSVSEKNLSESLDRLGRTALGIMEQRNEARLQLSILLEFLDKPAMAINHCKCENNGDYCDFHEMLLNAKIALREANL